VQNKVENDIPQTQIARYAAMSNRSTEPG